MIDLINIDGLTGELPDLDALIDFNAEFDHKAKGFSKCIKAKSAKIYTYDARRLKAVKDVIQSLPEPGEYRHMIVFKDFIGFDVLPAMLEMAGAARYAEVYMTSLGIGMENLQQLRAMFKAKQITPKTLKLLVSDYFRRGADNPIWDQCKLDAKEYGYGVRSARNHSKLILGKIGSAHYVTESSSNFRSCQAIEQFTITQSAELYQFHKAWIDEVWQEAKP